MRKLPCVFLLASILFTAAPLSAQPWDAPSFFSPRPGEDIGLYLVDVDGADDLGFAGIWRQEGNLNLGVRAGLLDGDRFSAGAEFYGPIAGIQAPFLLSWIVGFGGTFNDDVTWLRIPAGVSFGGRIDAGSLNITPYIHPRLALDYVSVDNPGGGDDSETELNLDVDLGADIDLGPQFVLRFGATVGDLDAIGVGVAYRFSRRLAVR